jgi:hypothetical protein
MKVEMLTVSFLRLTSVIPLYGALKHIFPPRKAGRVEKE